MIALIILDDGFVYPYTRDMDGTGAHWPATMDGGAQRLCANGNALKQTNTSAPLLPPVLPGRSNVIIAWLFHVAMVCSHPARSLALIAAAIAVLLPGAAAGPALPKSWDWREHGAVTPVENQGQMGAVMAYALAEVIEGLHAIKTGNLVSVAMLVGCYRCCFRHLCAPPARAATAVPMEQSPWLLQQPPGSSSGGQCRQRHFWSPALLNRTLHLVWPRR